MVFEIIDVVGYRPRLTIYGNNRYKTTFGKLIGSIAIGSIAVLCFYFTIITFFRSELSLIYNVFQTEHPIDITSSPIMMVLTDGFRNPISENFHEIRVDFWNYTKETNGEYDIYEIPLEPCDEQSLGEHAKLFESVDYKKMKCIPTNKFNLTLFGRYGDATPNSFINIVVNMCNNKTTNNACPDKILLESELKNVYLHFLFIDTEIDHYNFDEPIRKYVKSESLPIN